MTKTHNIHPFPRPLARNTQPPGGLRRLAVLSRKGGAGKTTLAVNLAVAAQARGLPSAVLDVDPQASASAWAEVRGATSPVVRHCPARHVERVLGEAAEDGIALALIDTAPHAEGAALTAARAADLVVIPCRPALFDLCAVTDSLDMARLANVPAVAVVNAAPARGRLAAETAAALANLGLDAVAPPLGQRAAFVHALTAGQGVVEYAPRGKAAGEVLALLDRLLAHPAVRATAKNNEGRLA